MKLFKNKAAKEGVEKKDEKAEKIEKEKTEVVEKPDYLKVSGFKPSRTQKNIPVAVRKKKRIAQKMAKRIQRRHAA